MKPYTTLEEALASRKPGKRGYTLLDGENGCTNGCRCGVSVYDNTDFPPDYGAHEDQEGFYVLEGEGTARLGDLEIDIKPGDAFVALAGVKHTIKCKEADRPVKVLWFHSAV